MRSALTNSSYVSAGWLGAIVAVVTGFTVFAAGDVGAWLVGSGVVVLLAAGWFAHMKVIDRSFAIDPVHAGSRRSRVPRLDRDSARSRSRTAD